MASAFKPLRNHFEYCPSCGENSVAPFGPISVRCEQCQLELHFSPAVSAAALIFDESDHLLVIKRKNNPCKGKLGVPGGFVDPSETLEQALAREVKEEVNLNLSSWTFLGGWPNDYHYKSVVYSVMDTYFVAQVDDFTSLRACKAELEGIEFRNPTKILDDEWAFPSLRKAVHRIRTLK